MIKILRSLETASVNLFIFVFWPWVFQPNEGWIQITQYESIYFTSSFQGQVNPLVPILFQSIVVHSPIYFINYDNSTFDILPCNQLEELPFNTAIVLLFITYNNHLVPISDGSSTWNRIFGYLKCVKNGFLKRQVW